MMSDHSMGNFDNNRTSSMGSDHRDNSFKSAGDLVNQLMGSGVE